MVEVPIGKSYDEAQFPGRRELLVAQGGSLKQLSSERQGFGGMRIFPGPVAGGNIQASVWQNVVAFNQITMVPELCLFDPVNGQFEFLSEGIWRLSTFLSVRHNNAAAYREMNARFRNTRGDELPPFQIPTGQVATITNFGFSGIYKIGPQQVSQRYNLQVQGAVGSNYTAVSWETCNLSLSLEGVVL